MSPNLTVRQITAFFLVNAYKKHKYLNKDMILKAIRDWFNSNNPPRPVTRKSISRCLNRTIKNFQSLLSFREDGSFILSRNGVINIAELVFIPKGTIASGIELLTFTNNFLNELHDN